MTVRLVSCEFCSRMSDFQAMHMCPVCRKIICKRCKHAGPLRPGHCAKEPPCEGQDNPPREG